MWGHAASLYSFGLLMPQVLSYRAAPCQYPSRPQLVPKVSSSWRIWHLSLLKLHWRISPPAYNFFPTFSSFFTSNQTPQGFPTFLQLGFQPLSSSQTQCSWSLFFISLTGQPGSSTNTWLLQVRTWSLTMSAFRIPPQPNPPPPQMQLLDIPKSEGSQGKRCIHVLA